MQDLIEKTKTDFLQAKDRFCRVLAATPDDRINWSPSTTARTPVQLAAHVANSVKALHMTMNGQPFAVNSTAEADKSFRDWERQFNTRDAVLSLIDKNSAAYVAWLETLTPECLDTMVEMPFGMAPMPVKAVITFQPLHMDSHTPQLEYIQTIYGDHDWR
jgi:hypothetical protein